MIRPRLLLALLLATFVALAALPHATATHNNQGTVKVHDNETENPPVRNVPHVDCEFWIEGFQLGGDSGWIRFFGWPPTGDMSEVTPTSGDLNWEADSGEASGEYHFLAGPFELASGHYRVEVYTHDGHPGADGGHFAKSKTFWVECDDEVTPPPCPPGLEARAASDDGEASITLTWNAVADADAYVVYRAVADGEFEMVTTTTDTTFVDMEVEAGVTYEYYVTAVIGDFESENCEIVEVTAIPYFPTLLVGALAIAGSVGAFVLLRRRS